MNIHLNYLHFSFVEVVIFVFVLLFSFSLLSGFVVTRYFPSLMQHGGQGQVAVNIIQSINLFLGVLLGFIIVVLWQNIQKIQETVSQEASTLAIIWRDAGSFEQQDSVKLQAAIKNYIYLVRTNEWRTMNAGTNSQKAQEGFGDIFQAFYSIQPKNFLQKTLFNQIAINLNHAVQYRRARLDALERSIPWPVILMLLSGCIFIFVFNPTLAASLSNMLYLQILNAGIAALLAFDFGLIYILDNPFLNNWAISNDAFMRGILS